MTGIQALLLLSVYSPAWSHRSDKEGEVISYLARYGYPVQDLGVAVRMFQRMSGLEVTGELDEDTVQQTLVDRCGAQDVEEEKVHHHLSIPLLYSVSSYPTEQDPSLMTSEDIDRVLEAAADLWNVGEVRLARLNSSDSRRAVVNIVFCEFSQCLENSTTQELARPVYSETTATSLIYLDTSRAWADSDSLSAISYGALDFHVQLLQVMVHQFGHVLGLAHTNRVTSVMMPFYLEWIAEQHLHPDKIDRDLLLPSKAVKYSDPLYLLVFAFISFVVIGII